MPGITDKLVIENPLKNAQMSNLLNLSLSTALVSFIWAVISAYFSLPGWVGFLGCTAYFAMPEKQLSGMFKIILSLLSGVFWACMVLSARDHMPEFTLSKEFAAGLSAFAMCYQARYPIFSYIPGTFLAASVMAGSGLTWQLVCILLCSGVVMGCVMEKLPDFLHYLAKRLKRLRILI